MDVKGAYTTIKEFLFTCDQCDVLSSFSNSQQAQWCFQANREIIIPDYQREFRWQEKQLDDLVKDINNGNCYLGQIAVSCRPNSSKYYLVDGQQRITSLVILLTVLARYFYVYDDNLNISKYELHHVANNARHSTARLNFTSNCFSDFQGYISQIYQNKDPEGLCFDDNLFSKPTKDSYEQAPRYINACSHFNKIVHNLIKEKQTKAEKLSYIKDLIDKIYSTKISVVVFEGNNLCESEKIFLDINEKGLGLDSEDILKAYFFRFVSSEHGDEALTTWTSLKENFFKFKKALGCSEKITLELLVNFSLQTALLSEDECFDYDKFTSDLRYISKEKKHICELFINSELQKSIIRTAEFLDEIASLVDNGPNSSYYVNYFAKANSTSRPVFHLLLQTLGKAEMKIIYIALIKVWWIKSKANEALTLEDIIQIFSFYIISNISGIKKEKGVLSKNFMSAKTIDDVYISLFDIERKLLLDSNEKASTLKSDQEKAEYLSFNIQMFYNDFHFNLDDSRWKIKLSNQEFLAKYSSNREKYIKDHFIIQNGKTIRLSNNTVFQISDKMKTLRKRAYNFIYHKDEFENIDFVSRINKIDEISKTTALDKLYGKYEITYFNFVKEMLQLYFRKENSIPTWEETVQLYHSAIPDSFSDIVSHILQDNCVTWNKKICTFLLDQLSQ